MDRSATAATDENAHGDQRDERDARGTGLVVRLGQELDEHEGDEDAARPSPTQTPREEGGQERCATPEQPQEQRTLGALPGALDEARVGLDRIEMLAFGRDAPEANEPFDYPRWSDVAQPFSPHRSVTRAEVAAPSRTHGVVGEEAVKMVVSLGVVVPEGRGAANTPQALPDSTGD